MSLIKLKSIPSVFLAIVLFLFAENASAKFITLSMASEDNFRNLLKSSVEKAVDAKSDDIYVDSVGGSFTEQLKQVKSFINAGADAVIIIAAGSQKENPQLFELSTTVPLVFINAEPIKNLTSMPDNTIYVGSNEKESGTIQMEELARLAGYKGNVALLIGEENHNAAQMRTQDVRDVMAKYPNMKLVKEASANWQRNQAYKLVSEWLKSGVKFDILVANNDEMIIGGIMAIKDAGLNPKDYLTGGIDATKDALKEMEEGNLDVTVLQDAEGQAKAAVAWAYRMIDGEKVSKPYWVPFRLVTQDNYTNFMK